MPAARQHTTFVVVSVALLAAFALAGSAGGVPAKKDREALPAPTNVRVTAATPTSVSLAWDPAQDSADVAGYYVYVDAVRAEISGTEYTGDVVPAEVPGTEYTALNLACGESIGVWIVAFDRKTDRSPAARATVSTAACPDTEAPTAPTGFHQSATTESAVMLEWNESSDDVGVVGYGVYRNQLPVQSPSESSATLTGLVCGSWFEYQVDAVDAAGNRSPRRSAWVQTARCAELPSPPKSPPVPAPPVPPTVPAPPSPPTAPPPTVPVPPSPPTAPTPTLPAPPSPPSPNALPHDPTPPSQPANLVVSAVTRTSVSLTWSPSSDNFGVAGYDVYRNGTKMSSVTSASFTLGALTCGTSFWSGVEAFDAAGNRSPRVRVNPTTSACPLPPASLGVSSVTTTSVSLMWSPSTDTFGIAGYDVYRNGTKMSSVTSTSSTQGGLACGTSYWFGVEALDAAGNRSTRVRVNPNTPACPRQPTPPTVPPPTPPDDAPAADSTPPTQPTNLAVASVTRTSVSLTWSPSTDDVGVSGYRVYVNGNGASNPTLPAAAVTGLTCGTAFTFELDAVDAAGNRSTRARVTASTAACADSQAPSAPTNVSASSRSATSIALTWSASSDNVGVTGYGLHRGGTLVGTASSTTGIFSGLTCNTNYTLAVDAVDAAANRSAKTTVMVATTACADTAAPSAPTSLAASQVTQSSLTLTWNASTDNVGVAGYDVFRNGTKMSSVTATSSNQSGLACNTSYFFGVEAFDAAGNRSARVSVNPKTSACPSPPPPPPGTWSGPITITQGGTYTGTWESTSASTPAVRITTTQPVVIENSQVRNLAGGHLIVATGAVQLTVRRVQAFGGMGRFLVGEDFKSLRIENCTIDKTRGIELTHGAAGSSIVITKNTHRNIQGNGTSPVGNFIQFREVQNSTVEVSWNQIINEYNLSGPEDLVSVYKSAHLRLHDNYFQHQSKPGNAYNTSSQNPITLENGDGIPPASHDNEIWNNQVVDSVGGIGIFGGHDNYAHDNRIVQDGYLPDGVTRMGNGYEAMWIAPGGTNNHMHANVIGFVNRDGVRQDGRFDGAPEGDAAERATNVFLPNPITRATEQNEWTLWQAKLASNGITLGA